MVSVGCSGGCRASRSDRGPVCVPRSDRGPCALHRSPPSCASLSGIHPSRRRPHPPDRHPRRASKIDYHPSNHTARALARYVWMESASQPLQKRASEASLSGRSADINIIYIIYMNLWHLSRFRDGGGGGGRLGWAELGDRSALAHGLPLSLCVCVCVRRAQAAHSPPDEAAPAPGGRPHGAAPPRPASQTGPSEQTARTGRPGQRRQRPRSPRRGVSVLVACACRTPPGSLSPVPSAAAAAAAAAAHRHPLTRARSHRTSW
jgi:hypothetical protein